MPKIVSILSYLIICFPLLFVLCSRHRRWDWIGKWTCDYFGKSTNSWGENYSTTLQAPSASAWGTGSSAEDESPEGTQAEVKIQNVKVRMKALTEAVVTKFRELFSNLQDVTVCTLWGIKHAAEETLTLFTVPQVFSNTGSEAQILCFSRRVRSYSCIQT